MEKEKITFRYTHDGDFWQWRASGEEGVYYRTDRRGEGVFRLDKNGIRQLAGTLDFTVSGLSERYAKRKILGFMKDNYGEKLLQLDEYYENISNSWEMPKGEVKMEKYIVSIRKRVEDWEIPSDEWSDEYYSEPFIEAESPAEAERIAKDYISQDCEGNPGDYEFLVTKYEDKE